MTISALWLAAAGATLLFAPDEVSEMLMPAASNATVLVKVLGAALLGFAAMNWTARASALGGIYGRAVVVGNHMHLMIGALLLVTSESTAERLPAYWAFTGLYVAGAIFFTYLMFFSSGLKASR